MSRAKRIGDGFLAALLIVIIMAGCFLVYREIRTPGSTAGLLEEGTQGLTDQFYSVCVRRLSKSYEDHPDDQSAKSSLGGAYFSWAQSLKDRGDAEEAKRVVLEGLSVLPDNTVLQGLLEELNAGASEK